MAAEMRLYSMVHGNKKLAERLARLSVSSSHVEVSSFVDSVKLSPKSVTEILYYLNYTHVNPEKVI